MEISYLNLIIFVDLPTDWRTRVEIAKRKLTRLITTFMQGGLERERGRKTDKDREIEEERERESETDRQR